MTPIWKKMWLRRLTGIVLVTMITLGGVYYIGCLFGNLTLIEFILAMMPQKKLNGANILCVGTDATPGIQRSDTIIVVHIYDTGNRIGVLSIPRDTYVKIEGVGYTKINHAYAYGGIELSQKTVSDLLGMPIDYYVNLDLTSVQKIVDQVGGITVNVDKNMYYVDQSGELYINLKKGEQSLTGQQAVAYLRYRHDQQGDIGRIRRQQEFLNAFARKIADSDNIFQSTRLITSLPGFVKTNLSTSEIVGLAQQFRDAYKAGHIDTGSIPGTPMLKNGVSYWQADPIGLDRISRKLLMGIGDGSQQAATADLSESRSHVDSRRSVTMHEVSRIAESPDGFQIPTASRSIRVEVLNGTGTSGIAQNLARRLKTLGVKVTRYGNAGRYDYHQTVIVDWKGSIQSSLALANVLGISPSQVIVDNRSDKMLDVSIIVGDDWKTIERRLIK